MWNALFGRHSLLERPSFARGGNPDHDPGQSSRQYRHPEGPLVRTCMIEDLTADPRPERAADAQTPFDQAVDDADGRYSFP
jgi:hypothetical protein